METGITLTFAAKFLGAAVLSSIALYARHPTAPMMGSRRGVHRHAVVHRRELVRGAARRDSGGIVPDKVRGGAFLFISVWAI